MYHYYPTFTLLSLSVFVYMCTLDSAAYFCLPSILIKVLYVCMYVQHGHTKTIILIRHHPHQASSSSSIILITHQPHQASSSSCIILIMFILVLFFNTRCHCIHLTKLLVSANFLMKVQNEQWYLRSTLNI